MTFNLVEKRKKKLLLSLNYLPFSDTTPESGQYAIVARVVPIDKDDHADFRGVHIEVVAHDAPNVTKRGEDGGINRVLRVGLRGEGSHCTGIFFLASSTLSINEKIPSSLRRTFHGTHR